MRPGRLRSPTGPLPWASASRLVARLPSSARPWPPSLAPTWGAPLHLRKRCRCGPLPVMPRARRRLSAYGNCGLTHGGGAAACPVAGTSHRFGLADTWRTRRQRVSRPSRSRQTQPPLPRSTTWHRLQVRPCAANRLPAASAAAAPPLTHHARPPAAAAVGASAHARRRATFKRGEAPPGACASCGAAEGGHCECQYRIACWWQQRRQACRR